MSTPVWDLPLRLFHWLLAIAVAGSVVTALIGGNLMEWHGRIGLFVLGLIVFRMIWGVVGSTYARFWSFLPTPGRILAYLRGDWRGLGHNPLGALSVFALLALIGWQAGSGLFANDDIAFEGPLRDIVTKDTSDRLTGIHRLGLWWLVGLVGLHIAAIGFYAFAKGEDLVRPMLTGRKDAEGEPARGGGMIWFGVAIIIAGVGVWVAAGGLLPPPPPPPPAGAIPAW